MNTISKIDILNHLVIPALDEWKADFDVDAIMDELLDRFPLDEWTFSNLHYDHPDLTHDDFWAVVYAHDISGNA